MFSRQSPARQHALRAPPYLCSARRGRGSARSRPALAEVRPHGRRSARGTCLGLAGECVSGERSERSSREKERSTYRQRSSPAAELPHVRPAQPSLGQLSPTPLGAGRAEGGEGRGGAPALLEPHLWGAPAGTGGLLCKGWRGVGEGGEAGVGSAAGLMRGRRAP